jgi:hypothetical protein
VSELEPLCLFANVVEQLARAPGQDERLHNQLWVARVAAWLPYRSAVEHGCLNVDDHLDVPHLVVDAFPVDGARVDAVTKVQAGQFFCFGRRERGKLALDKMTPKGAGKMIVDVERILPLAIWKCSQSAARGSAWTMMLSNPSGSTCCSWGACVAGVGVLIWQGCDRQRGALYGTGRQGTSACEVMSTVPRTITHGLYGSINSSRFRPPRSGYNLLKLRGGLETAFHSN